MAEPQILSITPERLVELLQSAGCRAETFVDKSGMAQIRSGSNGVPFNVRFGNRAAPPVEGYIDYTFVMILKLDGKFSFERVNNWNSQRRFARLHRTDDFLILDFDVIVAGGVSLEHLRATLELWDRLLQEFMAFMRGDAGGGPANAA